MTGGMARFVMPSVKVVMRARQMPLAEENGVSYFKIPTNSL
ncbi:hypothetical protein [Rhodoferax antarcticus]|uniref:Uncharacterized protein n=1 Tax=Rhodoferax antarcticus ANT.BR TaxID=1111071 RepID=A0A1Q8YBU6_9BURK|nr:hypothetical protein [Rhodoferax antarcticus]MCW2313218.1 hypothetical protein [Rhodoferax antarcticus]OLP05462.1 hypothetical protein BLL52_3129 [Rhodoferax antarcticus ANT.BR]